MGEHLAMKPFSNKKENSVENLYPEGKIDKVPKIAPKLIHGWVDVRDLAEPPKLRENFRHWYDRHEKNGSEANKMTETIKANDPKNREEFLELIAKKADRPRHELANDPLVFINDLPETTLSGLDQDELLALAKTNSEAIHVDFKTVPVAKLSETLENFLTEKQIHSLLLPTFCG